MTIAGEIASVEIRMSQIAGAFSKPAARSSAGDASRETDAARAASFANAVRGDIARLVRSSAARAGVDPALVAAVANVESGFDPRATSRDGAVGVMQLMPETARDLGVGDRYDPAQSLRGGAAYLRALLDRFGGDLPSAIAAYNAGPSAVERFGGVPPYAETREYVRRVLAAYRR